MFYISSICLLVGNTVKKLILIFALTQITTGFGVRWDGLMSGVKN